MFAGTEKLPCSQDAHVGEFKTRCTKPQTKNSTANHERQFSETKS